MAAPDAGTPRGGRMGKATAMFAKTASSVGNKMASMGDSLSSTLNGGRKSNLHNRSSASTSEGEVRDPEQGAKGGSKGLHLTLGGVVKAVAAVQAAGRKVAKSSARAKKPSRSASQRSASNDEANASAGKDRRSSGGPYSLGIKSIKGISAAMRGTGRTPREQQQQQQQDTPRYGDADDNSSLPGTPRYLNGEDDREVSAHFDTLPRHATGRPPPGMPPSVGPPSPTSQAVAALADIALLEEPPAPEVKVEPKDQVVEAAAQAQAAGLSVEASLALETAKWRLRSSLGGEVGRPEGSLTELLEKVCSVRSAEAGSPSKWPKLISASEKVAQPAVAKCLEAKALVIDPNMEQLEAHMRRMREEQISNAVSVLSCSSLRSVTKAKALAVHKCLIAALDDVEQQFIGGMDQVVKPGLVAPLDKVSHEICKAAVHAHRQKMEAEYNLADIEEVLTERVRQLPDLRTLDTSPTGPKMEENPLAFLTAAVMGSSSLGLAAPLADWLTVQVGRYLDPFIDGEVEPSRYQSASEGLFMSRLKAAWTDPHVSPQESQMRAAHGGPETCPVTPSVALAAYVRHCITKMNTNLGFSLHIPGMGRQPVPVAEQERHALLLGNALVAAIARDFAAGHRTIAKLAITPQLVSELAMTHLRACIYYQNELGNALARANVEGEEARRQERLRIWGFAS